MTRAMKYLFSLLLCLTALIAQAQIEYYAHTKTVYADGRTVNHNGQSGQFICRTSADGPRRCYDCTSNGRNHLNGTLFYTGDNEGNEVYKGKSYFGENSSYQFNNAKGLLNIRDSRGNIYVYRRSQAPAGRFRSSLISSKGEPDGWDPYEHHNPPAIDTGNNSNSGSNSGSSNRRSGNNRTTSSRDCPACGGKGRVCAHVGSSGFGVNNTKRHCNTCGADYYVTENHWHDCPSCGGSGRAR